MIFLKSIHSILHGERNDGYIYIYIINVLFNASQTSFIAAF